MKLGYIAGGRVRHMGGRGPRTGRSKTGRSGGGRSKTGRGTGDTSRTREPKAHPTIQEMLRNVSFLAKVSHKPDSPCLCCECTAADRSNVRPCAAFGGFCRVPVDVLMLLLSHLPAPALLRIIALLNAKWRKLAAATELWQPLTLARWPELAHLQECVGDWLIVHALWNSGAASDMLRLTRYLPIQPVAPTRSELKKWHKQWAFWRKMNTCPDGGLEIFRRTPLSDVRLFPESHVVMDAAWERSKEELFQRYRCPICKHELFIAVTSAQLQQIAIHGFSVVNARLSCRPSGGPADAGIHDPTLDYSDLDSPHSRAWINDFSYRLTLRLRGEQLRADDLVANTDVPGVYAFWYNPARAVAHRDSAQCTHLLCMSVHVPKCLPHGEAIASQNDALSYSMSPLNRESVRPKWVAEIGEPYDGQFKDTGWALLEMEWGVESMDRPPEETSGFFHPALVARS